jgi:hypothetical protein
MGAVYLAEHRHTGQLVAVKVLSSVWAEQHPEWIERFRREVRASARLDHPNLVRVHDADEVNGRPLLVMEYIPGRDLASLLQEHGPVPTALACAYIQQAAHGLHHAHSRGLVHRDVKPGNLLLTSAGTVKLLDFGLARFTVAETPALTQSAAVMGTVDYVAPEQANAAGTVDARADVYALGCTLYHFLAGRPPFTGGLLEKLLAHASQEPAPLTGVPIELARVVAQMMAKEPSQRFQSAEAVANALAPFTNSNPAPTLRRARWHRSAAIAAAVVGLGVSIGGLWHLNAGGANHRELPTELATAPTQVEEKSAPVWAVVAPTEGQYTSLHAAIEAAPADAILQVRPGVYREPPLVLSRNISIVGIGPRDGVVVLAAGDNALFFSQAATVHLRGLTVRARAGCALEVPAGTCVVEDCDFSQAGGPKTAGNLTVVCNRGTLRMRDCQLHDATGDCGVCAYNGGQLVLEHCIIERTAKWCLFAGNRVQATLRACTLTHAGRNVLWCNSHSRLEATDSTLRQSPPGYVAVAISGDTRAQLVRCHIAEGGDGGAAVTGGSTGEFTDCDLTLNNSYGLTANPETSNCQRDGWRVQAVATVTNCRITDNRGVGLRIWETAAVTVTGCDLQRNAQGAWDISPRATLSRADNRD